MYSQQAPGLDSSTDTTANGINNVDPNHQPPEISNPTPASPPNGDANGPAPDNEYGDSTSAAPAAAAAAAVAKGPNRYMKGRLPEGVDFAAYPGRSSTPLPTAESKSAERINQLKIWNEAATNDDKRRLPAGIGKNPGLGIVGSTTRRTDSYKEAKDRHSASFHGAPPPGQNPSAADLELHNHLQSNTRSIRTGAGTNALPSKRDMFADRSESDEEDDDDVDENHPDNPNRRRVTDVEITHNVEPEMTTGADQIQPVVDNVHSPNVDVERNVNAQPHTPLPPVSQMPQTHHDVGQIPETTSRQQPSNATSPSPQPSQSSNQSKCCTIM